MTIPAVFSQEFLMSSWPLLIYIGLFVGSLGGTCLIVWHAVERDRQLADHGWSYLDDIDEEFDYEPVEVDESLTVLDGHHRVAAARALGMEEVAVENWNWPTDRRSSEERMADALGIRK